MSTLRDYLKRKPRCTLINSPFEREISIADVYVFDPIAFVNLVQEILDETSGEKRIVTKATDLLAVATSSFMDCVFHCAANHAFLNNRVSVNTGDIEFGFAITRHGMDLDFVSENDFRSWITKGLYEYFDDIRLSASCIQICQAFNGIVDRVMWWVSTLNNLPDDSEKARSLICPKPYECEPIDEEQNQNPPTTSQSEDESIFSKFMFNTKI